jgi:alanine-synthesizing transaminase
MAGVVRGVNYPRRVDFRRINGLPPYVFAIINQLRDDARHLGEDVIDLGFGNPDIPSPDLAVDKLAEAARNPRNHRYSASRGIPKLRLAISNLYLRRFGVELNPDTEVVTTIGAKEGLSHLMWTLVGPGDTALVPTPSYPIHIYAPLFAGADVQQVRLGPDQDFFANLIDSWESTWPRPRVIVFSFPHNPTTECVDLAWMQRLVDFAKERDVVLVHDFAYSDTAVDPGGARRQGRGRRAVHHDQELLHGRVAGRLSGWQRRDRPGADQAEELPGLRDVPAHSDRGDRHHE